MSPSRRSFAVLLLALLVLGQLPLAALNPAAAAPVPLGAPTPANAEPGQLLIVFEPGTADAEQDAAVGRRGGHTLREFDGIDARLVALPSGKTTATATVELAAEPVVRYTQPNYIYTLDQTPNEPGEEFDKLWGLNNTGQSVNGLTGTADADIDAPEAWEITTGSHEVVVGVVDTGILYSHPDLAANMWTAPTGWNVKGCGAGTHGYRNSPGDPVGSQCDPIDEESHGTHVAGTIGAVGDNGEGVVGVNWRVRLMALRFFNGSRQGNTAGAIDVIDYAIKAKQAGVNLRVLNNSWTGTAHDQALLDQINAANAEGILVVAAAGNQNSDNDTSAIYPANYPNVLSVAATDRDDVRARISNFGATKVHLGAPGVSVYSTVLANGYGSKTGTSMAAPHVSGAAALLLSVPGFGNLTPIDLRTRLMSCGDPIASLSTTTLSGKRLNIDRAIRGTDGCATPPPPNPLPTIDTLSPSSGLVGGDQFTLTVNGSNFVTTSVVRWNGANRPTSYVSSTQLTAAIPTSLLATSGTAEITVFNPPPEGGTSASVPFAIEKEGQAITFAALADRTYGDRSFTVSATASSGLAVSFDASGNCTIADATVTLTGAGSCTITATQAGDGTFSAAQAIAHTFAIAPALTTVIVPPVIVDLGTPTATLSAEVVALIATNGGTVTFAVTEVSDPIGTITSGEVTDGAATADFDLTGLDAGRYTITASYTGTTDFAAGTAIGILSIGQTQQTIDFAFDEIATHTYGDPAITLTATTSSELPVTFAVPAGGPCTLDGATLTIIGVGECRVTASQPGDDTYAPAPNVTRTFAIAKATPLITWPQPAAITYGTPLGAAQLNATADVAGTFAYQPIEETILGAGEQQLSVTFTPDDSERYANATASVILTVGKATQSIIWPDPLPNRTLGTAPFAATANATSRQPVTLTAQPSSVCTLSGTTITLVGVGTCTVTATQSGDANHLPAATLVRTFQIVAPPSPSPSPSPSVAPTLYTLTLAQASGGTATANPGPGQYPPGEPITLTATPNSDQLFTGWLVDGQLRSYASTATLILSGNRTVAPSFATRQSYGDVPSSSAAHEAITQLAARGVIRGYTPDGCAAQGRAYPCFGPNDQVTRAQMAALIARAMGWDAEDHGNPFTDRGGLDASLWRNVGTLAHYNVAFGYGDGRFGPNDKVTYAQTISFISRAMVVKGFWQARTVPPAPTPYGGILNGTGHQNDVATYLAYTDPAYGGVPDHPTSGGFADWSSPSSRGWFARALWAALRSQYGAATIP